MTSSAPARTTTGRLRIRWPRVAGLLAALAAIAAMLGPGLPASPSTTPSSPASPSTAARRADLPPREHRRAPGRPPGALSLADGAVPAGTTVFADGIPGVAGLDPALLGALRQAAGAAAAGGVELLVDSGWRSPAYQQHLLQQAVSEHGSEAEAARWVATPETSAHVSGDAVDIGPPESAAWLSAHGAEHGLCPVYDNEPWHFELRPEAIGQSCPATYPDPTYDPRMTR